MHTSGDRRPWMTEEDTNNPVTAAPDVSVSARRGPPNRMNDLSYTEWMKFQKSFFRHTSYDVLVRDAIAFFTKDTWPDGHHSRVLLMGFPLDEHNALGTSRQVESAECSSVEDVVARLESASSTGEQFDFVFVNLSALVRTPEDVSTFVDDYATRYYRALRAIMRHGHYCGTVVDLPGPGGAGFPLPWAVALASRDHLRLRDEKVGLIEGENRLYYCLYMQADDDGRPGSPLTPAHLHWTRLNAEIVPWVMPKSPPRKKDEILHPAKFPESLVEQFIRAFTREGESVLDPMVGTGSAVVAAVKLDRNGLGVELSQEFATIAQRRVDLANPPVLFEELRSSATGRVVQGDATKLDQIPELDGKSFKYCVTSPPYWSMLSNPGSENQRARRERNLPLVYSGSDHDLGNVTDYDAFLGLLVDIYGQVAGKLEPDGVLTVVVKNVKREHILYTLAWDLVAQLCGDDGAFDYIGTTLWCQDDVGIKPFAVGIYWVSNILHTYCLHFRLRRA